MKTSSFILVKIALLLCTLLLDNRGGSSTSSSRFFFAEGFAPTTPRFVVSRPPSATTASFSTTTSTTSRTRRPRPAEDFHPSNSLVGTTSIRTTGKADSRRGHSSRLLATADGGGGEGTKGGKGAFVNVGLIGQLALNQAIVGSTIWTGGPGYEALTRYADFGSGSISAAALGAAALIAFSRFVETSESPLVTGLNLSTEMSVLRLFGPKRQPVVALAVSAFLAGITGVVEEVTFRGLALPRFADWSSNNLGPGDASLLVGAALSTLLFAVLHTNPLSFFKGGDATKDNLVLLAFQLVTGSIFAALFLGSGQNLAVPIGAHALYDFYTFYSTHLDVTGQMEYAATAAAQPGARSAVEGKWRSARGEKFLEEARQTFYLMDSNKDGVLSRRELRIALSSYGMDLSKEGSARVARSADYDKDGVISFGEFLDFVGPTGSTGKAVKTSLLGPV